MTTKIRSITKKMIGDNWQPAPGFLDVFCQAFMAFKPEDTWGDNFFHLSDAAECLRRTWYRMSFANDPTKATDLGHVQPEEIFTREMTLFIGHAMHRHIQEYMVEHMKWCTWDDIEVPVRVEDLNLKGSIDAIVPVDRYYEVADILGIPKELRGKPEGSHFIIDIKTKGDKVVKTRQYPGKPLDEGTHTFPGDIDKYVDTKYFTQQQAYMSFAMELYPERYPDVQRAYLLYICKNDGRPHIISIDRDPEIVEIVKERAQYIKDCLQTETPPPQEYNKSEKECCGKGAYTACPYFNICWKST